MAGLPHGDDMRFEQAALAESARSGETDGYSVGCGRLELIQLGPSVNKTRGGHWTLVVERIHRTECTVFPHISVREYRTLALGRSSEFAGAAAEAGADQGVLVAGADDRLAVELLDREFGEVAGADGVSESAHRLL